jgi:hypothetical protein
MMIVVSIPSFPVATSVLPLQDRASVLTVRKCGFAIAGMPKDNTEPMPNRRHSAI